MKITEEQIARRTNEAYDLFVLKFPDAAKDVLLRMARSTVMAWENEKARGNAGVYLKAPYDN